MPKAHGNLPFPLKRGEGKKMKRNGKSESKTLNKVDITSDRVHSWAIIRGKRTRFVCDGSRGDNGTRMMGM